MQDFRDLKVWQKAHEAVLQIYRATQSFPDTERYGLTSQIRRAAVSVPANIAEGSVRSSDADFARFLHIAADQQLQEIKRMLNGLLARLKRPDGLTAKS